jgi:hypothetical protein
VFIPAKADCNGNARQLELCDTINTVTKQFDRMWWMLNHKAHQHLSRSLYAVGNQPVGNIIDIILILHAAEGAENGSLIPEYPQDFP